jgi:hypothetical protein
MALRLTDVLCLIEGTGGIYLIVGCRGALVDGWWYFFLKKIVIFV